MNKNGVVRLDLVDEEVMAEDEAEAMVKSSSGNVKLLYDVYYIPSLSQNLLSGGQLMATGYSIMFDDATCVIKDKKSYQTIVDVRMTPNKLFPLVISDVQNHALAFKETNRGGEFVSHEFNNFYQEHDIRRELIALYTPEQNGVAERKNRTVVEIARSMFKVKGLSNQLWEEVVTTVVYLLNLSPTRVILNQTPYEAWLYKPVNGKIIINRNMIFNEDASWSWEENTGDVKFEIASKEAVPHIEVLQPPSPNMSSPPTSSSASSNSSISSDDETPQKKFKNFAEIYASTQALFVADPTIFKEAIDKEEWRIAMKEEIAAIQHSDWAGCLEDRRSTSGYVFGFGSGVVCWSSKKQATTALSSSEVEYIAATSSACQTLWLRRSKLQYLKLDSNILKGSLPVPPMSTLFYISSNSLSGEIPQLLCNASSL
ncbi:hypothetical protein F3Y22_tig00014728pilonHSYRG00066 [Hibiscus syriacus]|uniref:Integrase catalytic domain-containing protein n=1 Tax=Hibiscus syriacus TaxID=106335 RepID=A0A6A3BZH5_HIBSY|nr:hypothetical protein F3Y22_tig00014728pilonHSYRG00066 [Hibiscus syriacus]